MRARPQDWLTILDWNEHVHRDYASVTKCWGADQARNQQDPKGILEGNVHGCGGHIGAVVTLAANANSTGVPAIQPTLVSRDVECITDTSIDKTWTNHCT